MKITRRWSAVAILLVGALACNAAAVGEQTLTPSVEEMSDEEPTSVVAQPEATETSDDGPTITSTPTTSGVVAVPATTEPSPTAAETSTATPASTPENNDSETVSLPEEVAGWDDVYTTPFGMTWPTQTTDHSFSEPVENGYRFVVEKDWAHWAYTTQASTAQFRTVVEVLPETCGEDNNGYGLIFHYQTQQDYRVFLVTCDGRWRLFEREEGERTRLASGMVSGDDPSTGLHTIHVAAFEVEDEPFIAVGYDGEWLEIVPVAELREGDIGVYAETGAEDGITVDFVAMSIAMP